jgi:stage V sporulation protein AE
MSAKRKVIIVTDGDKAAKRSIEKVANNIGGRCISLSCGNPTVLSGKDIAELIMQTPYDPVLVMVDDKGCRGQGKGETALIELSKHPEIEMIGAVAVASNSPKIKGIKVNFSITNKLEIYKGSVNKEGEPTGDNFVGDTAEILNDLNIPCIVGIGDVGKMDGADKPEKGVPVTTKAVKEIMKFKEVH